jgi:hypothetical protein
MFAHFPETNKMKLRAFPLFFLQKWNLSFLTAQTQIILPPSRMDTFSLSSTPKQKLKFPFSSRGNCNIDILFPAKTNFYFMTQDLQKSKKAYDNIFL